MIENAFVKGLTVFCKALVQRFKMSQPTTLTGDLSSFRPLNALMTTLSKWNDHNKSVLKGDIIDETDKNTSITKNCIEKVIETSCHDYAAATAQLKQRTNDIYHWKAELESAITDITSEIEKLESQRQQLKNAMDVLNIPEYITQECLDMRMNRMQSDLVYDDPQQALFGENILIENIKVLQRDLLRDIESQMRINVFVKTNLERDWSNKKMAFKYESENSDLETKSANVKESAGATMFCEEQSNKESWESYTVNNLEQFKTALKNSKALRAKVETALLNSARDMRNQDIKVDKVLSKRIAMTEQVKIDLEHQLTVVIARIAETENIIETLHEEIRKVYQRIQVAQTRLRTKHYRPYVENCREASLQALIDEVKDLNDSMTLLQRRSEETKKLKAKLIEERSLLENEITVKKKSIYIDNERCLFLRSHYQSAEKLSGF